MSNVHILYYSPLGTCEKIAGELADGILSSHPDTSVTVSSLTKAADRKRLTESGISCDLLFFVFPMYAQNIPKEIAVWMGRTAIKATFSSIVCAYGQGNPIFALKRINYYLRRKKIPVVSAMDIPVGRVHGAKLSDEDFADINFDALSFAEKTLQNADAGKRLRISVSAFKDKFTRYFY